MICNQFIEHFLINFQNTFYIDYKRHKGLRVQQPNKTIITIKMRRLVRIHECITIGFYI